MGISKLVRIFTLAAFLMGLQSGRILTAWALQVATAPHYTQSCSTSSAARTARPPTASTRSGPRIAQLFAEFPSQRQLLEEKGEHLDLDHIVAGYHAPADLLLIQPVGVTVAERIRGDAQFLSDLGNARAEMAQRGSTTLPSLL